MRINICLLLAAWSLFVLPAGAHLPTAEPGDVGMVGDLAVEIRSEVHQALEEKKMPGCVVAVGRKGKIVFQEAFGNRQVEPTTEPMTLDTVFDLASLTKPIATATSIMQLVEQGKINLDDPVNKYLPEFRGHGKEEITVEQLMIHTSGLTPDNALADYAEGWPKALEKICQLKLLSSPGDRFRYSDVGFLLLGEIVARVSGQPLDVYVQEHIFQPLKMRETTFNPPAELQTRAAPTEKEGDAWLRGVVHDPRARRCQGVAGHAGLFSTAHDLSIFAQALLNARQPQEDAMLGPDTLAEMTRAREAAGNLRALGWDKKSAYSRNRGAKMSPSAYGHGGFTGTAIWIDPELDLFVIFLSNRVHPAGSGEVNTLAGKIGTIASAACRADDAQAAKVEPGTKLGVDVLAEGGFQLLRGRNVGLIANHTSRNKSGRLTTELLAEAPEVNLVAIFSPEHGFTGSLDQSEIVDSVDPQTGVPIRSLYGKTRKPTAKQLKGIDTLVFDIQDIGCRFYTYISTMGLAMEAAAEHDIRFVVLDRPNPIGGQIMEGPLLDDDTRSFVGFHSMPVRHGMTIGEIAQMLNSERALEAELTVVKMQQWHRDDFLFDTGLPWRNTSPNMRSLTQALIYPGVGLLETTNVSVGRGTDTPFELLGAPWINGIDLAAAIEAYQPVGVRIVPIEFTPDASKFEGELCGGVNVVVTDWETFRPLNLGWCVAAALCKLYPDEWDTKRLPVLLGNQAVYDQIVRGAAPQEIEASYAQSLQEFSKRREPFLMYENDSQ